MPARKSRKKFVGMVVINVVIIAMGAGLLALKNMYPDGPQTWIGVPGLQGDVEVYKDELGIPHIYGDHYRDVLFVQGYIMAEDRLFQLEVMRRAVRGTLSEIFGPDLVSQDLFLRTLGIQRSATLAYQRMSASHAKELGDWQRFVDGINFYLATHRGNLPLEYSFLALNGLAGYQVPDFNLTDVFGMGSILGAELTLLEMWDEINRYKLIKTLGWQNASDVLRYEEYQGYTLDKTFPQMVELEYLGSAQSNFMNVAPAPSSASALPEVPQVSLDDESATKSTFITSLFAAITRGGAGSNNWVVAGSHTESGYPLLENDPHLGLTTPSIWKQFHLYAADVKMNVTGVTAPLVPGVVIGHNENFAWGITASFVDDVDLYGLNESADGKKFLYKNSWVDFEVETGAIPVLGGAPVPYQVKVAPEFGPLLNVGGYKVAVKWMGHNASTFPIAVHKLNQAQNYSDFKDALSYWDAPSFNFVYADVNGTIAYWTPGKYPLRAAPYGIVPTNGSSGLYDWNSYLPFGQMPHYDNIANPDRWYFVTANARNVNASYSATYIGSKFETPIRMNRISELIQEKVADGDKMTFEEMMEIQGDILSVPARTIMSNVTAALTTGDFFGTKPLLANWNYKMAGNSSAATVWHYFFLRFLNYTFADEYRLYKGAVPIDFPQWTTLLNFTLTNCSATQHYWFDDVSTPTVNETMGDIIRKAMKDAIDELEVQTGSSSFGDWNWSRFQTITWRHEMGDALGDLLKFFHNGPYPWESDTDCVQSGDPGWRPSLIFICEAAPGMRHASLVNAPGENGNIMGPNYGDQVDLYLQRKFHYMPFATTDVLGNCTLWGRFLP